MPAHAIERRAGRCARCAWLALLGAVLFAAGCTRDEGDPGAPSADGAEAGASALPQSASAYFEDALRYVAEEDYASAIIQFRNAIQQAPDNVVTRIELGKALLAQGKPSAAQLELERARELGAHPDIVAGPLAQSLLEQGKFSDLEREVARGGRRRAVESELLMTLAEAYSMQREVRRAMEALERARQLAPRDPRPLVRQAELEFEQGRTDEARAIIAEAADIAPQDGGVWAFKGRLAIRDGDREAALAAYAKARQFAPEDRAIRIGHARTLLLVGQVEAALAELAPLHRPQLADAEFSYVYALALAQRGDMAEARRVLADAATFLAGADNVLKTQNPSLLMLSALISFVRGEPELALKDATMLVQVLPRHLEARYLLALIQSGAGEPEAVLETLEPVRSAFADNGAILLIYGDALRASGRARDALPVLERALVLMPDSHAGRVMLAQTHIMLDNLDDAIAILDRATADGRDLDIASGSALVAALVRDGDAERAVDVATLLVERFPDSALAVTLAGELELGLGHVERARVYLERALAIDARHAPAKLRLAMLEQHAGNLDAAAAHYRALIAAEPAHTAAMFGLARTAEQEGDLATAYQWLEKLRAIAPRSVPEVLYLAELYRRHGELDKSLQVAEKLAGLRPEDATAQMAYGQILGEIGRHDQARTVLRRSTRFAGYKVTDLKLLAARQLALGDSDGARTTLRKALQSAPQDAEILVQLVRLDMDDGDTAGALARIEELTLRFPASGLSEFLRAEVYAHAGRHEDALAEFRAALRLKADVNLVERVHAQLMRLGRGEEAAATLEQWLASHPDDARVVHLLAATWLHLGAHERAERALRALLVRNPDNPNVLNNLAWLLTERGAAEALEVAARAHRLAPNDPGVLDTYGWALVKNGQPEQGLRLLREAIARGGNTPGFRYRLAYALSRLDRDVEAADILQRLLAAEPEFPERQAALALREEIGS